MESITSLAKMNYNSVDLALYDHSKLVPDGVVLSFAQALLLGRGSWRNLPIGQMHWRIFGSFPHGRAEQPVVHHEQFGVLGLHKRRSMHFG